MLGEAVAAKRGLKAKSKRSIVEIDLSIDAYIPADYIEDERQKIDFYKRIQRIESVADHDEIDADLIDRFGDYPQEVSDLLEVGLIKITQKRVKSKQSSAKAKRSSSPFLKKRLSACRGLQCLKPSATYH